jgi:hypothetical protein
MRTKVLTISLVLLMALLPLAMQSTVAAPGLPALSVTVADIPDVNSDPVEFVHVSATATVTVENFPLGATVNVNATAQTWVVDVSPTEFTVPSGSTSSHVENINLDIRVPPRASAESPILLRFFANTTTTIGIEYSDEAFTNISVKQFNGLRVNSNATMTVKQDKNLTSRLRITNSGNGLDNYTISLNNIATLTSKGLTINHAESVHEVGRDRTVSETISVVAAADAEIGTVDALFTIRSQGDNTKSASWMLTITVEAGDNGNGGNGGNGNGGNGGTEDDNPTGLYVGIGLVIIIFVVMFIVFARNAEEEGAEDEKYVAGRDRDAEDD